MQSKHKSNKPRHKGSVTLGVVTVGVLAVVVWGWVGKVPHPKAASTATYVGQERCAQCHGDQVKAWRSSHHAQAMQVSNESTILGKFDDAHFTKDGVSSIFFKKNGKFYVEYGRT